MRYPKEDYEEIERLIANNPGYLERTRILRNPEHLKKFEPEHLVNQLKNKTVLI